MPKKRTSKILEDSFESMPSLKLKKGVKTSPFGATRRMKNKMNISKALWECLVADDVDGFKEILKAHLELVNKDEFAEKAGIPKRTLYRMLSPSGNPTLENISKIVHRLCA